MILGIHYLLKSQASDENCSTSIATPNSADKPSFWQKWLSPQTYGVAAVTVANGSDNIGIYVPLFASSTWEGLLTILFTFFSLVGVWCYLAYKLTHFPAIAKVLTGYGNTFVPCVLIGLGVFIVKENLLLALLALGISYVWVWLFSPEKTA
ncbi:MAG: cadmium resistance transporter [Planktothrix sp. GU0601_MAG3]|nr:MAG: cadmium resistance transporter [Planktothrix sp. GU0601_MAG3]